MTVYPIEPMSAPRMTRADAWKKRPVVLKYRAFKDACQAEGLQIPGFGHRVTFVLPMPKSWSKSRKKIMNGSLHCQKPDIDNLLKAALDAIYDDDSVVSDIAVRKVWGEQGAIVVVAQ